MGDVPLWGAFLVGSSPAGQMLSCGWFDWLVIDMQHSPLNSSSELLSMVQAISLGQSAPFLRAPWKTQYGAIMAALDAGVEGVIVPMLETAEEQKRWPSASAILHEVPGAGDLGGWPWPSRLLARSGKPPEPFALCKSRPGLPSKTLMPFSMWPKSTGLIRSPGFVPISLGRPQLAGVKRRAPRSMRNRCSRRAAGHGKIAVAHTVDPDDALHWARHRFPAGQRDL